MSGEDPKNTVDVEIHYPGYFLPTFGLMVFDVTFDERVVAEGRRYLPGFTYRIATTTGRHRLRILGRNLFSGVKHDFPFFIEFPTSGSYRVCLTYDKWGISRWKAPIIERTGEHERPPPPTVDRRRPQPIIRLPADRPRSQAAGK